MILYPEVRRILAASGAARILPVETVSLMDAVGWTLAEDVLSPEAVPAFDNSAMDGYALCAEATLPASEEKPLVFDVAGTVAAGETGVGLGALAQAQAVEIMTGAPIPAGAFDAVMKVEEVEVTRTPDGNPLRIAIRRPLKKWENVRRSGEDFLVGQLVARAGEEITPESVLALSSLGVARVRARRKPRVAIISTGRELVDHSIAKLEPGMIRNSTAPYLLSALAQCGAEGRFYGTIADDPEEFSRLLARVRAERPDVILTTGAVSMGKYDFVKESLARAGARVLFHKAAIRPGKPILFAELPDGPVVFGLPGNPISTGVGLRFFVEPWMRAARGLPEEPTVRARLRSSSKKPEGLRCFFKARLSVSPEGALVEVLAGQASFMVSSLLRANAWVVLAEDGREARQGSVVDVYPMFPLAHGWSGEALAAVSGHHKGDGCCA